MLEKFINGLERTPHGLREALELLTPEAILSHRDNYLSTEPKALFSIPTWESSSLINLSGQKKNFF